MTEQEWLASDDAAAMIRWLTAAGADWNIASEAARARSRLAGDRKLRLFACACARLVWDRLKHPELREAVEYGEEFADGVSDRMVTGYSEAGRIAERGGLGPDALAAAWMARVCCMRHGTGTFGLDWPGQVGTAAKSLLGAGAAALLREVAGNPFRPMQVMESNVWRGSSVALLDPIIVQRGWLTPTVLSMAQYAYDERPADGTLDWRRLAILADALEEAGCDNAALLQHLRPTCDGRLVEDHTHVRGCWAVDLLLGRD